MTKENDDLAAADAKLTEANAALERRISELEDKIADLEGDAEDQALRRLAVYRTLLADFDCVFGLQWLPIAIRFRRDELGELL